MHIYNFWPPKSRKIFLYISYDNLINMVRVKVFLFACCKFDFFAEYEAISETKACGGGISLIKNLLMTLFMTSTDQWTDNKIFKSDIIRCT